jgi:hypothetical protein
VSRTTHGKRRSSIIISNKITPMTSTNYKSQAEKILSVIERKRGRAKLQDFKRSIAEFNTKGGTERLREVLNPMIEQGTIYLDDKYYSSGNSRNVDPTQSSMNHSCNDIKVIGTHELILEGVKEWISGLIQELGREFAKSLIPHIATTNGNIGNDCGNDRNTHSVVDSPKSATPDHAAPPLSPNDIWVPGEESPSPASTSDSLPDYNETPF